MFKFSSTPPSTEEDGGLVLFISLPDAISGEWASQFEVKHCTSVLDINLSKEPEILCAAVYTMNVQLGQFIIHNLELFGFDGVIVVAEKDSVYELSLLDSKQITPIEYLSLFVDSENDLEGEHRDGDDHNDPEE